MSILLTILYFVGFLIVTSIIAGIFYLLFKISQAIIAVVIVIIGLLLAYFIQDSPSANWLEDVILGGSIFAAIILPISLIFGIIETLEMVSKNQVRIAELENKVNNLQASQNTN